MPDAQDREEPKTRVIAIGGSADGLTSLTAILQALPRELPTAIVDHPTCPSRKEESAFKAARSRSIRKEATL